MWATRRALIVVWAVLACAAVLPVAGAAAKSTPPKTTPPTTTPPKTTGGGAPQTTPPKTTPPKTTAPKSAACTRVLGRQSVAGPTNTVAWKAGLESRIGVFDRVPGKTLHPSTSVAPTDAPWLLILARPRAEDNRCWVLVRLPWRPNTAAGWINANLVFVQKTPWRIQVSTAARTLTLFKAGKAVRTVSVVVGKPSTPTPTGLFAIAWAIPWNPNDFLGSWVLELTAHSNVLQSFDGGDGTVGIHGRGGTSLLDPLGSALSHGCIRLANDSIDWLVGTVGEGQLPGTPVQVST
jgi:lipoprotein-anchoring transpeptidase ErfK/SrfK